MKLIHFSTYKKSRESKFIRESIQKWNDFNNHFPFSVNKVDSFFLELAGSSRYCQLQISEILYQTIKSNCLDSVNNSSLIDSSTHISSPFGDPSSPSSSSPLSFSVQLNFSKEGTSKIDNPEKLFFALTTFEVLNDINSLLDLLIWLLQCSPFHIFGFVILKFIKRYESAFLCQNNLNVIFDILIEKVNFFFSFIIKIFISLLKSIKRIKAIPKFMIIYLI